MIRATSFKGQRVAVFGLGVSGVATVRSLVAGGAEVSAWDDAPAGRAAAEQAGLTLTDLSIADWSGFTSLVLAPGVPLTHPTPHWTVEKANANGVEIIGDVEIFSRQRADTCDAAPWIAITGTNGKSSTTALTAHILRHAGYDVQMGGNIGRAILTLEEPGDDRFYVVEMSSYQIDLTPMLNATVGVLLNITPDHIDRHGTLEHYAAVKQRLLMQAEIACISADDELSLNILKQRSAVAPAAAFSVNHQLAPGYCLVDETLVASNRDGLAVKLGHLTGIDTLRGKHNAQNALAAVAAVRECLAATGRSTDIDWQGALAGFPGLPHRLEQIGHRDAVVFINDSKATNADSAEKALASCPGDIFWIVGGKAKDGGIESLRPYFKSVRKAYLIGEAADAFAATLAGSVDYEACGTLDAAVAAAARDAAQNNAATSFVLLAPACASFDQFRNFEVRGDAFRDLVAGLDHITMRERS